MVGVIFDGSFVKLVSGFTISSVTACSLVAASVAIPAIPHPTECYNAIEWVFIARMVMLSDDIQKKAKKQDFKKMWGLVADLKNEVEIFKNQRINVGGCFQAVVKDVHSQGYKLSDKEIKTLWALVNGKTPKSLNYENYLHYCYQSLEMPSDYGYKTYKRVDDKDGNDIPISVQIGITMTLAGYFLQFIPEPSTLLRLNLRVKQRQSTRG